MPPALPPLLAAMVAALNAHDSSAFLACLADDAIVRDEGRAVVGRTAIREWFEDVSRKYGAVIEVTDLVTKDGEPVLSGKVSGNFDGSPVDLRYYLGVEDGKIIARKIDA